MEDLDTCCGDAECSPGVGGGITGKHSGPVEVAVASLNQRIGIQSLASVGRKRVRPQNRPAGVHMKDCGRRWWRAGPHIPTPKNVPSCTCTMPPSRLSSPKSFNTVIGPCPETGKAASNSPTNIAIWAGLFTNLLLSKPRHFISVAVAQDARGCPEKGKKQYYVLASTDPYQEAGMVSTLCRCAP